MHPDNLLPASFASGVFFCTIIARVCIKMSGVWDLGKEIYLVDAP